MRTNFRYHAFALSCLDEATRPIKPSDLCSRAHGLGATGTTDAIRQRLREAFASLAATGRYQRLKVKDSTGYFYQKIN